MEAEQYELRISMEIYNRHSNDRFSMGQTLPLGNRDLKSMLTIMSALESALKSLDGEVKSEIVAAKSVRVTVSTGTTRSADPNRYSNTLLDEVVLATPGLVTVRELPCDPNFMDSMADRRLVISVE